MRLAKTEFLKTLNSPDFINAPQMSVLAYMYKTDIWEIYALRNKWRIIKKNGIYISLNDEKKAA